MAEEPDQAEFLWNVHSYLNEYIRFADTKAELVIGWTSALMGALMAGGFQAKFSWAWPGLLSVGGFALLIAGFTCAFIAVYPRASTTTPAGLIFWQSIRAYKDKSEFAAAIKQQSGEARVDEVAGHLFDLAGVAVAKFRHVRRSIVLGFFGSILCGIMYLAK